MSLPLPPDSPVGGSIDFDKVLLSVGTELLKHQLERNQALEAPPSAPDAIQPLSVPPVPLDDLDITPFPIFVPTTINSLEVSKAAFSGYLVPTTDIAYLARQWENYHRLNGTADQTGQLFPIPAQPADSFEFPCPEAILKSPILATYLSLYKVHTMLFYQSISQPTINSYQLIPSLIGQCEHTNNIYRTFSLESNPLLNSRFYSIYPAPIQQIRKMTQSPSIMIRESGELYAKIHKPYIDELTKDPRSLGWLYDILDGKKERETILLQVHDKKHEQGTDQIGSRAFIMAKDTKWGNDLYSQAMLWSALQVQDDQDGEKQRLCRTLTAATAGGLSADSLPPPLIEKTINIDEDPPNTDHFPDPSRQALPGWLCSPIWCLIMPMDRSLRSIRDLTAAHLPLLKAMRDHVYDWFQLKFNIPSSKLVLYFHYSPTFYHLHLHVNHVSFITETTFTGKVEELTTVINNIEMMPDYYQKCTKLMYLHETHGIVARFKAHQAATPTPL